MEDMLWAISQQSRVLQEFRQDIRGLWSDEAAREINSRYLDPHEQDNQQMLAALQQQAELLSQVDSQLQAAQSNAQQANHLAEAVVEHLKLTEQDLLTTHSHYNVYAHYNAEAQGKLPQIYQLIQQADSVCG